MGRATVRPVAPPADALKDLTEISTQIESAVVLDREGTVVASTLDDERAGRLAGSALELLRAAEVARPQDAGELVQLDVAFRDGSVFLVADRDRLIAATTHPEPTIGLVFYDLKSSLRALGEGEKPKPAKPKPKRAPAKRTTASRTRKKADDEKS
jgi:predicted regulator of Ras-like GTPase activity (Roadblock/LC7/MglB family)